MSTGRTLLFGVCLLTLTACGKTLDSEQIAQSIQQDVIQQGGVSLKTVTCPTGIKPEAGKTFECVGEIDSGYTFTIPVKQQDDRGTVLWDIPHAKGLMNLVKFETLVQDAVTSEVGSRPVINCGGLYKAVRPGQTFDCQMATQAVKPKADKPVKTIAVKPSKPDKITVMIDSESNINWQRVIPNIATKPTSPTGTQTSATSAKSNQPNTSAPVETSAAKPIPAKSSAEDFRNTVGSSDSFED